jgi:hypothetical protein
MPAWWRSRGSSKYGPVPEWAAPLGDNGYARFVALLDGELRRRGLDYEMHTAAGVVVLPGNMELGLHALTQVARETPKGEWPDLFERHFRVMLDADAAGEDAVVADFARARQILKLRLYDPEAVAGVSPEAGSSLVSRPVAPGLITALVCDFPERVRSVSADDAVKWPVPAEHLFELAARNVMDQDPPDAGTIPLSSGQPLTVLSGESFFITTHALWLDRHLDMPPAGALVGVPNRHVVVAYPIRSMDFIGAVGDVLTVIEGLHERGPGSLSTKLYWWYLGTLRLFEAELTDGTLRLTPPDELTALMGELISD